MTEPFVLSVRDFSVDYLTAKGSVPVLRSVSLDVGAGQVFAIAGESGCGKSTLAQAILRVLPPPAVITGGSVRCAGFDVLGASGDEIRGFRWREASLVLQSAIGALNPVVRIRGQIADAILHHDGGSRDEAEARARDLLPLVGLEPSVADRYPHELSGGMRQRVGIAMALALRPRLVILDEPTTALDVMVARDLLGEVLRLRDRFGLSIVFITHDLSILRGVATHVAVMHAGAIVEQGPAGAVLDEPEHPHARRLVAALSPQARRTPDRRAPRASEPVLEVRGLRKVYSVRANGKRRDIAAVDGVDLALHAGEVVALVGESGSGKSTVARMIARLSIPTAGEIRFQGEDVVVTEPRASKEYRRRVQMIFQDPFSSLNPMRTVRGHLEPIVSSTTKADGEGRFEQVLALLSSVGLDPPRDYVGRYPHMLSGGQRQRVAIARALATNPAVLVADEPTSMLDLSLRLDILRLLDRLRRERALACLLITHDLQAASLLADRVAVMRGGRIVENRPAQELLEAPEHPYTRALFSASASPPLASSPMEQPL